MDRTGNDTMTDRPYTLRQWPALLLHLLRERTVADTYKIKVIKADTGEVVKVMEAVTERAAERVERGLNINMNHADHYTVIEPPKDTQ